MPATPAPPASQTLERQQQTRQRSTALIGIGFPTLVVFGAAAVHAAEWTLVALVALTLALILGGFCALRLNCPTNLAVRPSVLAYTLLLLYVVLHSGDEHSRALWFFSLPVVSVMLLDPREGLAWAVGATILAAGLMLLSDGAWGTSHYSTAFVLRFTITALLIAGALFWSEILLLRYQSRSSLQTAALQDETARLEHEITRRGALERELRLLASTDALTQLLNRRAFMESLQREMARSSRNGRPLTLAILDIDHFKKINDRCGHPVGDTVLVFLAQFLKLSLRTVDLVGRIGGEEFAIALVETDADGARQVIDRLFSHLRALSPEGESEDNLSVSISLGATTVLPGDTLDGAILRADEALYAAKEAGRDQYRWR